MTRTAAGRPRLFGHAVTSLVDQAWLSALNLLLGLLLIRLVAKEAYGVYAQLYVAGLFATSMAEALVTNPLTTLAAGQPADRRRRLAGHLARFQGQLSTGLAVALGLAAAGFAGHAGLPAAAVLGLAFAAYVKTTAVREYRRSLGFLEGRPRAVLRIDLVFGVVLVAGTAGLAAAGQLSLHALFAVMALANLAALRGAPRPPRPSGDAADYRRTLAEAWQRGRLGLPGALIAWVVNYSYLYLAALWLGATAAADLNAARLLLMPITLGVVAWSRVARPAMGRLLVEGGPRALVPLLAASIAGIELLTLAYCAVLWFALPWLERHVLGAEYAGLAPLVAAWSLYFVLNAARWIGTAVMMSLDRYGFLLAQTAASLVVMLAAIAVAMPRYGTQGAILALCLVEAFGVATIWAAYAVSMRRPR